VGKDTRELGFEQPSVLRIDSSGDAPRLRILVRPVLLMSTAINMGSDFSLSYTLIEY
jgi:hypothetical protein